ncbi:hypothetical protein A499_09529 [Niallia nealsonii AAU1]|nr:hypothetical protein A499_09529 [Niallia nealsonii AAU1]
MFFFNRKKELVGKMEQPEYTKTPVGLARQSETPEAQREPRGKRSVFRLRVIATNFTKTTFSFNSPLSDSILEE